MLAVASVCVFMTSCKDDDVPIVNVTSNVSNLEAAEKANPNTTYKYELDGVIYNSVEELQAALNALEPGSTGHTYTVIATDKNDPSNTQRSETISFTVPTQGSVTVTFNFPTPQGTVSVTIIVTVTPTTHSGGAIM